MLTRGFSYRNEKAQIVLNSFSFFYQIHKVEIGKEDPLYVFSCFNEHTKRNLLRSPIYGELYSWFFRNFGSLYERKVREDNRSKIKAEIAAWMERKYEVALLNSVSTADDEERRFMQQ